MRSLASLGHDATNLALATERARAYGKELHTGVFYRNPQPPSTYGQGVTERHNVLSKQAVGPHQILDRFLPAH